MPNKYSHAFVLSSYESRGIIDSDRSQSPKASPSLRAQQTTAIPRTSNAPSPKPRENVIPKQPAERWILSSSPPAPVFAPAPLTPQRHSRSSSIETQIYAPISSPISASTPTRQDTSGTKSRGQQQPHWQPKVTQSNAILLNPPAVISRQKSTSDELSTTPFKQDGQTARIQKVETFDTQRSRFSPSPVKRVIESSTESPASVASKEPVHPKPDPRQGTMVVSRSPRRASSSLPKITTTPSKQRKSSKSSQSSVHPLQNPYNRGSLSARAFVPECPPSPPDTPSSSRSFSLSTAVDTPDPMPPPPQIPERSPHRDLPRIRPSTTSKASNSTDSLISGTISHPKLPTRATASIATQTSSSDAAIPSVSHPKTSSNIPSSLFPDDDSDLESLPSTVDFDALPLCNHITNPVFIQESPINSHRSSFASPAFTRASSFDSAAPPPIALNRPTPPAFADIPSSVQPASPKTPKRPKPSLASSMFFRSTPKAILYSQTTPGRPPIPVSVSRTSIPSIPTLFPNYQGQFPPLPQPQYEGRRSTTTTTRSTSVEPCTRNQRSNSTSRAPNPNVGPKSKKDERCPRAGRSTQRRGDSVPPRSTSRRRSLVRALGLGRDEGKRRGSLW